MVVAVTVFRWLGRRLRLRRRLGRRGYGPRCAGNPVRKRVHAGDERPLQTRGDPALLREDLVAERGGELLRATAFAACGGVGDRRRLRGPPLRQRGRQSRHSRRVRSGGRSAAGGHENERDCRGEPQHSTGVPDRASGVASLLRSGIVKVLLMPMLHGCAFPGCSTYTLSTYCVEHELLTRAVKESERMHTPLADDRPEDAPLTAATEHEAQEPLAL
jgi:hypothetical protein